MNAFNFLERASDSSLARITGFEFTSAARRALLGLLLSVALLAVFAGIERLRLGQALAAAHRAEARLQLADASVRTLRTSVETVARLSSVARSVGETRLTGAARAREIAEIAGRLPRDAWLTSLACEGSSVTLKGAARDFEAVSRAIAAFAASSRFSTPQLVVSRLHDAERFEGSSVDFEVRLQERPQ